MGDYTIVTNNVPREILNGWDLTSDEWKEFDYLDHDAIMSGEDSASFFRYKDSVYDLGEFQTTSGFQTDDPMKGWDGYSNDSYFSGILVKFTDDFERVIIARYYC